VFQNNFARSSDGGKTWQLATGAPLPGPVYCTAYAKHSGGGSDDDDDDQGEDDGHRVTVFATGPGGTAWSSDEGDTWQAFTGVTGLTSVGFASPRRGWLTGLGGQIFRIDL
jgi:hypothetical protein